MTKKMGYTLEIMGVRFFFMSDRHDFLGRCLRLHYGTLCRETSCDNLDADVWKIDFSAGGNLIALETSAAMDVSAMGVKAELGFDATSRIIASCIPAAGDREEAGLFFVSINAAVQIALRERGLIMFHGAAVSIGGKAAMFAGPNGCGKSTLMKILLQAGADYLSDDSAALLLSEKPVKILRNPELVNVAGIDAGALLNLQRCGFREGLDPNFIEPPENFASAELKTVVFPSLGGVSGASDMGEKQALLKLIEAKKTPLEEAMFGEFFAACGEIVSHVRCVELEMKTGEKPPADELAKICF